MFSKAWEISDFATGILLTGRGKQAGDIRIYILKRLIRFLPDGRRLTAGASRSRLVPSGKPACGWKKKGMAELRRMALVLRKRPVVLFHAASLRI